VEFFFLIAAAILYAVIPVAWNLLMAFFDFLVDFEREHRKSDED